MICAAFTAHNAGVSQWAGRRGPWCLIWPSKPMPLGDARKLENLLKRQKAGVGLYRITGLQQPGLLVRQEDMRLRNCGAPTIYVMFGVHSLDETHDPLVGVCCYWPAGGGLLGYFGTANS